MFAKALIVCVVAAAAFAIEYPAGVNPAVCPDYPLCDAGVLARYALDGTPLPNLGLPLPVGMVRVAPYEAPAALRYPADFDPALCPNYPYCF